MSGDIWLGIIGTAIALGFFLNSIKNLRASPHGHAANAGRLHIMMVIVFVPVLWLIVLMRSM